LVWALNEWDVDVENRRPHALREGHLDTFSHSIGWADFRDECMCPTFRTIKEQRQQRRQRQKLPALTGISAQLPKIRVLAHESFISHRCRTKSEHVVNV
jgi:hypothetical protein